jgi:poly-beta-1,6-N-acetyl-D-glucosamine synthase
MVTLLLLLFLLTTVIHLADLWQRTNKIHNHPTNLNPASPSVSIIVVAHDEEDNLRQLLPRLVSQTYPNLEIILVLDRCSDSSKDVALALKEIIILEISETPAGIHPKKHALETAIKQANGEWILLTDADCLPSTDWATSMANTMNNCDVVLGYSPYQKESGILNQLIQYETSMTAIYYVSWALNNEAYMGVGRNLAYKREVFLENSGFGDNGVITGGDDDLLVQALAKSKKIKVCLDARASVESVPEKRWCDYIKQKTRHFSVARHYVTKARNREALRWAIHMSLYIWTCIMAAVSASIWPLSCLFVIWIPKALALKRLDPILGKRVNPWSLPVVDSLYVVILPLVSLRAQFLKHIAWKN